MKKLLLACCLLVPALLAANLRAEERAIGKVKGTRGIVSVIREGKVTPLLPGMAVRLDDVIMTGSDGAIGLLLDDNTLLSMGPISRLTLDQFDFSPATNQYGMRVKMQRGTIVYLSGMLGKLAPHAVTLETPVGTISMLKESNFMAKFDEE